MSNVIAFRRPAVTPPPEDIEIDPLTAIDVAIRDLADITRSWGTESALIQAEECRQMLRRAYEHALTSHSECSPRSES